MHIAGRIKQWKAAYGSNTKSPEGDFVLLVVCAGGGELRLFESLRVENEIDCRDNSSCVLNNVYFAISAQGNRYI